MIHVLEVGTEETPEQLRKRARKLAMTGGYEVQLSRDLTTEELKELARKFEDEHDRYPAGSAAQSASLAGRILSLIQAQTGSERDPDSSL